MYGSTVIGCGSAEDIPGTMVTGPGPVEAATGNVVTGITLTGDITGIADIGGNPTSGILYIYRRPGYDGLGVNF
jgi:hypothetical protein